MSTERQAETHAVALPVTTLRLLVGALFLAVVVMFAMLVIEVVILLEVFDLVDLVERLAPAAWSMGTLSITEEIP